MNKKGLNYVRFDVGHYLHVCHKSTVNKFADSVLAKLVSPEFDNRESELDYIVIDRDGKHFATILNFMRDESSLNLTDWTDNDVTDLMREADFYGLTSLLELCEQQFKSRESQTRRDQEQANQQAFVVPAEKRLEIIYGLDIMKEVLAVSQRPVIVISYRSMRKFHIDSWIEELMKLCDHSKYKVYCFSSKSGELCDRPLSEFIMSLFDPDENKFIKTILAPADDKFRARRAHYKCKIFKFWFMIQNDLPALR